MQDDDGDEIERNDDARDDHEALLGQREVGEHQEHRACDSVEDPHPVVDERGKRDHMSPLRIPTVIGSDVGCIRKNGIAMPYTSRAIATV